MQNVSRTNASPYSSVPRRGAIALVTTVLAVILLFSFKTADPPGLGGAGPTSAAVGAPGRTQAPGPVAVGPTPTPAPRSTGGGTTTATPTPATGQGGGAASGTFTGHVVRTPYGPVQVAIVMDGGKMVDVQELQLPSDRRLSQQISDYAGPILRSQALAAQSANIDGVSGASYTSDGFYQSLQSALSQVH